jgi:polar amino acid transport system substrate-binding protein
MMKLLASSLRINGMNLPRWGLLVLGLVGCNASPFAAQLNFVTQPFPPYSYAVSASDDTAAGPMAEIVQAACKRLHVTCHSSVHPWRQAFSSVVSGGVDGMFSLMPTEDRKASLYFTDVIVRATYSFFARDADSMRYKRPADLNGRTIVVFGPSGTSAALESILNQTTTTRMLMEPSNETLLKTLNAGGYGPAPVFLMNRDVAYSLMKQYGIHGIKPVGDLMSVDYAVAFSRKRTNSMLVIGFNDAVRALIQDGTIKGILNKYGLTAAGRP